MNARSLFRPLITGLFNKRLIEVVTDCRGAVRTIKHYTGINKGRKYPYANKRQTLRQKLMGHRNAD